MKEVIGYFLVSTPMILFFIAMWKINGFKMAASVFATAAVLIPVVMLGGSLIKP